MGRGVSNLLTVSQKLKTSKKRITIIMIKEESPTPEAEEKKATAG